MAATLKKPTSAYWLWLSDNREKITSTLGSAKATDVAKKGGEMWKALSEAAKRPYEAKAKEQKDAYEKLISTADGQKALEEKKAAAAEAKAEKKQQAEALAEKKAAKEERKNERACSIALKSIVKDEALKKPQSAYWLWLGENREKIVATIGTAKGPEVAKKGGEMWKSLNDNARAPYEKKAKEQKEAYDKYIASEEGVAALKAFKDAQQSTKEQFKPKQVEEAEPVQQETKKRKVKEVSENEEPEDAVTEVTAQPKKARGCPAKVQSAKLGA